MASMWRPSTAFTPPVRVMNMSPTEAASSIVITLCPSIAASSARTGLTSVTMVLAPMPLARMATPLPHQP